MVLVFPTTIVIVDNDPLSLQGIHQLLTLYLEASQLGKATGDTEPLDPGYLESGINLSLLDLTLSSGPGPNWLSSYFPYAPPVS
uniref:Uncharacterized protein n=1 Tax=Magnetospirillum gryphiswaldense TaxID=55518 RepID=A4U3B6_9PROT|nr:hypothetical protein MGR_2961 [Magnetospirillum gryphiswaldense MSR-1]